MKFKMVMRRGHKQQVRSRDPAVWSCDCHVTLPTAEGAEYTTGLWTSLQSPRHPESESACHVIVM